ncbi:MAG TPA: hypothetical protein VFO91_04805 [Anaerolineales bacterium]|nr:hypothetical protein [Anaerolineales bacterium]
MRISKRTRVFSILAGLAIFGACAIVYLFTLQPLASPAPPGGESVEAEPTAPLPSIAPTSAPEFTPQPALPERRRLTLEFPPRIRAGDSDRIRLTLEVDELGNITPTAEIEGNVITGQTIEIPNLYETHYVVTEARLDVAGMEISPPDLSSQTLAQGQTITFYWSIRLREPGIYRGTVWLYLRFVDKQSGEESRKAVSAQLIEIEAVHLFGLSGPAARTAGVIGSVVATIIGFPFFEQILKFLIRKRKKR